MEKYNYRDKVYIRVLELMSLITEDVGKIAENSNNYLIKGWNPKDAERALKEIQKIQSPLNELEGLLLGTIKRQQREQENAEITPGP